MKSLANCGSRATRSRIRPRSSPETWCGPSRPAIPRMGNSALTQGAGWIGFRAVTWFQDHKVYLATRV